MERPFKLEMMEVKDEDIIQNYIVVFIYSLSLYVAGLNPLHNSSSFGHADVVRLLLEAGANPNTRDNWNCELKFV